MRDRGRPKGLTRILFRAPILLYRLKLGWILGKRFLRLTHTGRKSGLQRDTVLEVVDHGPEGDVFMVIAAWGERLRFDSQGSETSVNKMASELPMIALQPRSPVAEGAAD